MKNLFIALFLSLFIIACNSDDDDSEPSNTYYRLVKIENFKANDSLDFTKTFVYDLNNRFSLLEINTDNVNSADEAINYIYDSNNTLIQYERNYGTNIFYICDYVYDGPLISKIKLNTNVIAEYNYNSSEQMVFMRAGSNDCEFEYTYNNNGNVSIDKIDFCANQTYYMTYDDKKNPYELVYPEALYKIETMSINNTTRRYTSSSNNSWKEYEYNSKGYPIIYNYYYDGVLNKYQYYYYDTFYD